MSEQSSTAGKKTDRTAIIVSALRNAIIEQAVKPGMRLPEDTIGEQFGASRTVVRAALQQLVAEGLVQQQRNRSATVAEPSWAEARDTFDLRLAVENLVIRRLAKTITPEQIASLRAHVEKEERAQNANELHSIRLAGEFHALLAEFTGSEILTSSMRGLASRCCLILSQFSRPHSSECGVSEHRKLVDFLEQGDEEVLASAMHDHMRGVVDRAVINPQQNQRQNLQDLLKPYLPSD